MGLIGIFGYLGYLDIQKSNANLNSIIYEIGKNNDKIKLLQIIGLILDIFDYILIRSEKAAPELLHEYYLEHTVLVKVIYYFGGLVLIGIYSAKLYIKKNVKNNNAMYNEVEVR
jgi:hypothetical protein